MGWQADLIGEDLDIAALAGLTRTPAFRDLTIVDGPDQRKWLAGERFSGCTDPEEVQTQAGKILATLNGLARIQHANHRPVSLGAVVANLHDDGRVDRALFVQGAELRLRTGSIAVSTSVNGSAETAPSGDPAIERAQQIACDPRLAEIVATFAGDITWQRLRVGFEKLTALVGRSGKDSQALVREKYAERAELESFKANAEDPRHSGIDAVHGVATGPLKGKRMSEQEGLAFVVRLLNTFLDRQREPKS